MNTNITARQITARLVTAGLGVGAVLSLGFTSAPEASATSIIRSKSNITNNRVSGGEGSAPAAFRRYPPNGYPCLGCHPCPPSFCDNDNNMVVWHDPTGGSLVALFTANAAAYSPSLTNSVGTSQAVTGNR